MSNRSKAVNWAIWYSDFGTYKASPEDLIEIFRGAGVEAAGIPSLKDAQDSMGLLSGAYVPGFDTDKATGKRTVRAVRHWCGIFCCYIYRQFAGNSNIRWSLTQGKIVMGSGWTQVPASLRNAQPGDIAVISAFQHHYMITAIDLAAGRYDSVDGNAGWSQVKWYSGQNAKYWNYTSKVGAANFKAHPQTFTPYTLYRCSA